MGLDGCMPRRKHICTISLIWDKEVGMSGPRQHIKAANMSEGQVECFLIHSVCLERHV